MRLLLVITDLAYGGAETQVVRLAEALVARGWEVRVVTLLRPRAYVEELVQAGVSVEWIGVRGKFPDPRPLARLIRVIRLWRPHIVHSHLVHANLLSRLACALANAKVLVCTAHSVEEGGRVRELLYRLTDPLCDLTTQVSRTGVERYVRVGAVPWHKIRYVPNGVDTDVFKPDAEARQQLRVQLNLGTAFAWLAVGRLETPKDYATMLRAFGCVATHDIPWRLLIAGEGALRSGLEALARELAIGDRVLFLGVRRDVPQLMNAADAYVLSSKWEGMPLVLLEASASGLPIVATDVGGNAEIVVDGVTGFLVPANDADSLSKVMLRVMAMSPDERRQMGEAARRHVEYAFALKRVVGLWEELYLELLAREKGGRVG